MIKCTSLEGWAKGAATLLFLCGLTVLPTSPAEAESVDWAQTFFDAGHSGTNTRETTLSPLNVSNLQLEWSRTFSGEVRAFVVNDHRVIARVPGDGGTDIDLWYMEYSTGEPIWHIDTGPDVAGANGTLAVGDHRIISECGLIDLAQYRYSGICAYRKRDGREVWQFANPCNCSPEANVAAPLAYDHHVALFGYFNGGSSGKEYVLAASSASGRILGAYQAGGQGTLGSVPIARGYPKIYLGCGGNICALHANGTLAWQTNVGTILGGITADGNDRVFVTLCNGPAGLIALDDATGNILWSYGAPQCNQQPVATSRNTAYFTTADGYLHAVDAGSGTELWSAPAGAASSPSVANGVVYVAGAPDGPAASAYDAATGVSLWSIAPHPADHALPPMVIDGTLYVANAECGSICAYRVPAGYRRHSRRD